MKRLLLLLFVLVSGRLIAQIDSVAMMKNILDAMEPGKMHTMLAKLDGTWNTEATMWMSPDSPPVNTTGITVNKMIMSGRYQESTYTGDMMGMPFQGMSITGYDNMKKEFFSSWIDNMGTGIINMEGQLDNGTRTIYFKGKVLNPATLKDYVEIRQVFKLIDDNTYLMEMHGPDPATGKEYKNMEIKYTRNK